MNINKKRYLVFIFIIILFIYSAYFLKVNLPFENLFFNFFSNIALIKNSFQEKCVDFFCYFVNIDNLYKENEKLKLENRQLKSLIFSLYNVDKENRRLEGLLKFNKLNKNLDVIPALVIGRNPAQWFDFIVLNKGSKDGIKKGMPVLTIKGLVGRIFKVYSDSSKVLLITNPDSAISVKLFKAKKVGILYGSDKEKKGLCFIKYISKDGKVFENDIVLTSGYSKFFQKDIFVGKVVKIDKNIDSVFYKIWVKPFVDFENLNEVFIIKRY